MQQRYRVLRLAIETGREDLGFTRWDAASLVGCFELASRIGELESEGVRFERTSETLRNRYGDRVRVMTYRLAECPPSLAAYALHGEEGTT
jgi:hypothetical protein